MSLINTTSASVGLHNRAFCSFDLSEVILKFSDIQRVSFQWWGGILCKSNILLVSWPVKFSYKYMAPYVHDTNSSLCFGVMEGILSKLYRLYSLLSRKRTSHILLQMTQVFTVLLDFIFCWLLSHYIPNIPYPAWLGGWGYSDCISGYHYRKFEIDLFHVLKRVKITN